MPDITRWDVLAALLSGPTWATLPDGSTREVIGATRTCVILRDDQLAPLTCLSRLETLEVTECLA